jgi:ankyrin repeat protein
MNYNLINKKTKNLPVLHLALSLYTFDFELLEKILELNKDFLNEFDENKKTPLFVSCENALIMEEFNDSEIKLIDFLLKKGADSSILCSSKQESVIHWAALERNTNLIQIFIKHECELNILDINNENVLHKAIKAGNNELIEILLNAGIDYNLRNKDGITPIDLATIEVKNQIYKIIGQIKKNEKNSIKELQTHNIHRNSLNIVY